VYEVEAPGFDEAAGRVGDGFAVDHKLRLKGVELISEETSTKTGASP
jgi:hypothetical protein